MYKEDSKAVIQKSSSSLPDYLQAGIQSLSGIDVSNTNVHLNSSQPAQFSANAYAQGNDIHVSPGQESTIPHEAWHVVQQSQGRVEPTAQYSGHSINASSALENEADIMGSRAVDIGKSIVE